MRESNLIEKVEVLCKELTDTLHAAYKHTANDYYDYSEADSKTITDIEDPQGRKEGALALQLHGGMDMTVEFKDIKKRNPDVILMEAQPITARDWRERWSQFSGVKAVANRQLLPFVDARLNRMGPSAIDGVEGLCKLLRNVPR